MIRFIDIVLSVLLLIIFSPILLIVFILAIFDTKSPLFFQKRIGQNNNLFSIIKFRTMKTDTLSVGTHMVDPNSITKLGAVLRKTKLDELPQLINVLVGHMSLVGPRPCLPTQEELIVERTSRNVHLYRPGITGLSQINNIDMSTPTKLACFDEKMLNEMGIVNYFKILFRTAFGSGQGDKVKVIHSD
ncbi:sugar transferase [Zooshikella ganghwensis]|uniref:Sugar transferase n=1 Tax=Zooshikella ganghwensis TaxID=202772 RepID=A0A4P9VL87_9GAMM|nr:sugar transferase [Zooshikella ganghwensis]RDH43164.1 sugar transferase [Zooshikella ganghwensis]